MTIYYVSNSPLTFVARRALEAELTSAGRMKKGDILAGYDGDMDYYLTQIESLEPDASKDSLVFTCNKNTPEIIIRHKDLFQRFAEQGGLTLFYNPLTGENFQRNLPAVIEALELTPQPIDPEKVQAVWAQLGNIGK